MPPIVQARILDQYRLLREQANGKVPLSRRMRKTMRQITHQARSG